MIITICPNCKMRVIPKEDGTCPSCQSIIKGQTGEPISSSKPIETTYRPPVSSSSERKTPRRTDEKSLSGLRCPDCKQPISDGDIICPHCGVNLEEPIEQEISTSESLGPKRGFWLTAMLLLWSIGGSIAGIYYLVIALTGGKFTSPLTYVWLVYEWLVVGFAIAIWKWKKWGVYGLLTCVFLSMIINLYSLSLNSLSTSSLTVFLISYIVGLLGVSGLFYLLFRRIWKFLG